MPDYEAAATELTALATRLKAGEDITWSDVHAALARAALQTDQWAGYPMPVDGMSMTIHPRFPFAAGLSRTFQADDQSEVRICRDQDITDEQPETELRNMFLSHAYKCYVQVWRIGKKFVARCHYSNSGPLLLQTIGAARAWEFEAELRAIETLKRHLNTWQYQCYVMTGMFLESSPRSGIYYLFRRLRPTVAMSAKPHGIEARDVGMHILACLCLHSVGFYNHSWAGALVPSDDVLAHLLLMRADEYRFWKQAEQHPAIDPASGL